MKVFLSGEGRDNLGDWGRELQYRSTPPVGGIVEALLRKVAAVDFQVIDSRVWKRIRKYRSGGSLDAEVRNVLGLMIEAEEVGADVLVFVRDQDGDEARRGSIEKGLRTLQSDDQAVAVVGGVAVREIHAWILALLGERRSEQHADAKNVLEKKHAIVDGRAKVAVVEVADVARAPTDAASLHAWLNEARRVFGDKQPAAP